MDATLRSLKGGDRCSGSASPPSELSDNSKVSSSPSAAAAEAARNAAKAKHRSGEEPDLASRLALAEAELREEGSGPSSTGDSESRDSLQLAQQAEEELERRSNAGSLASSDAGTPKDLRSGSSADMSEEPGRWVSNASSSSSRQRDVSPHSIRDLIANFHSDHSNFQSDHSKSGSSRSMTVASKRSAKDDPKSSSSSSNTQQHRTNMELWDLLLEQQQQQKNNGEDTVADLQAMMATMAEKHGMEMDALQKQLRKTLKREIGKSQETAHAATEVAGMEAKQAEKTEELKAMYQAMSNMKKEYEEEKGDLQDWIAGQEARSSAKIKNLKIEYADQIQQEQKAAEEAKKGKEEAKMEMAAHNMALEKELVSFKVSSKSVSAERDVLRRNLQNMQASHQQHVNCLKEQLDMANRELKNVARSKMEQPNSDTDITVEDAQNLEQVVDLREQLAEQHETHREMSNELSELRVQMLGMQATVEAVKQEKVLTVEKARPQQAGVGDLQMLLEAADVQLADLEMESMPRTASCLKLPNRRGGGRALKLKNKPSSLNKLGAIVEDDISSMGASAGASATVSSDGGPEEVGDLHDFDEDPGQTAGAAVVKHVVQQKLEMKFRLDELKEKLAEDHIAADKAKEELAEKEAIHTSKVARLMDVVECANDSKDRAMQELLAIKANLKVKDAEHMEQVKQLQQMLATSEEHYESILSEQQQAMLSSKQAPPPPPAELKEADRDPVNENLWQQLCGALEAKRIAEGRVEEFKRAMMSMERQHNDVVAELKQQLLVANGSGRGHHSSSGGDSGHSAATEEIEDLKQQLRSSTEERNVITNSLEWKEVQWKSKVENMEMNHSAAIADLRRRHESEVKELTLRLEGELTEVRQRLEDAQEKSKQEEKVREPAVQAVAPSWLTRLRCPTRGLPGAVSTSSDSAAYCQDVCWRILNTMQGITALLCSIRDYKILQATRTACMTWGSAALHGQSVLTLVNGPARAAWLRKAFQMHQSIADTQNEGVPGFVVRDLGCEEFTSKTGQTFDSSVITAHLPAEPGCNKEAALLVIIEPQANQRGTPSAAPSAVPQQPVGRVEPRGGNQSSAHSEVSTVDPSDSASNIFDRNMGMFFRQQ